MKAKIKSAALLFLVAPSMLRAVPVELGRESFETVPGIGYTTSTAEFDDAGLPNSDFFGKFPNDGARTRGIITGGAGTNAFMAEDIDQVAPVGPTQFLTTNAFSIAGKTSTSVKVLLAAPGTGPSGTLVNGGHQNHYDWSATASEIDFVRVEASVDGGPFNRLIQFSPLTATLNQQLGLDSDGDGLADAATANLLTASFREFDLPFPTGSSVQVRVVMHTNATNEYILVDNVRIFGDTPATAAPVLAGVPAAVLTFAEGSSAQPLAPAITVTDADSANLASATITIPSGYVNGEDVLSATPSGAIVAGDIVFAAATGTLTITRTASKATYQTVLRSVAYRNTNTSSPNTGTRQVQFRVSDATANSNQPIRQVQVTDAINTLALPFTENFETDGRGTRYALDGAFINGAAHFDRRSVAGLTNTDGPQVISALDTEVAPAGDKALRFHANTAGQGIVFASVRLGALGGAIYDSGDLIEIESSADGGAWQAVAKFRSTAGFGGSMAQDTDNDGLGDGPSLSATLRNFTFTMPVANTLGVRVRFVSNVGDEQLVADRFSMISTPDGPFIPVPGTLTHSEDFNSLPAVDGAWADSTVRKGWYAQMNNGTTPAGAFPASDGTTALTGLINCGAATAADRALGSKATSNGGAANIAYAALFKNVSTQPVKLTRLRYTQEYWRSSASPTVQDKVTTFYALSAAPLPSILSGTNNATAVPGAGFTALPAAANTFVSAATADIALDGNVAPNRSVVDHTLVAGTEPVVQPGEYFTLKWTDTNEAGFADGHQAIDDVVVDFEQLDCSIATTLGAVTRKPGVNPADPADDLVDFVLTITGVGTVSPLGFSIPSGNFGGNQLPYGTYLFVDVTVNQFTPLFTMPIQDQSNAACATTVSVGLPSVLGLTSINGTPEYLQVTDAPAFFRQTGSTELTLDPGALNVTTDSFTLTPGAVDKCITFTAEAQDLSTGSGFDLDDTLKVELLTFGPQNTVQVISGDFDLNGDGFINGAGTAEADEYNPESQAFTIKWTSTLPLVGVIPGSATSFQIRITAQLNNTSVPVSEVMRFRGLTVAPCADSDNDGVLDAWEWAHGTNPASAASRYTLGGLTYAPGTITGTLPTVTGRSYQALATTDLLPWIRSGPALLGNDSNQPSTVAAADPRQFVRWLVAPVQTIQP